MIKHKPKQIEYIQQRFKTDCGIACFAMLTNTLYHNAKDFFKSFKKSFRKGIFPEDLEPMFETLNYNMIRTDNLSHPSLVAIQWKDLNLSGHFIVWCPKRKQFLDPLHGVFNKSELLKFAFIEAIWKIVK